MTNSDTDNLLVWRGPSGEELVIDAHGSVTTCRPSGGTILNRVGILVDQVQGLHFLLQEATGESTPENQVIP